MSAVFEDTIINGMGLKNRLVRSATWEGMCDTDGRPTEKLVSFYKNLTKGGVGLIITGYTFVRPEGKQLSGKMGITTDDFEDDFKQLTGAVHEHGGKVVIQLVHAGGQADQKSSGLDPLAPSSVHAKQYPAMPKELTKSQISDIVEAFGDGAERARQWGFDGIQLHGSHGYLINQFLSPLTNLRADEYGGDIENRSRFLMQVYRKVREKAGNDYPVMIKLNASDNLDGGLDIGDAIYAAKRLSKEGIDAIEVSSGTAASGEKGPARKKINKPEKEGYNVEFARRIKKEVSCPVMVVGGFRSYAVIEKTLKDGGLDYISMSRPLIREPDLPNRWLKGDLEPAKCISCNSCFIPGMKEGGIYCVVEKKQREKEENK